MCNRLTINVPVVFMARDEMILMGANPISTGHLKGWVLKIETIFSPEMAPSEASAIWPQKSHQVGTVPYSFFGTDVP
jgi:hypothetical protein